MTSETPRKRRKAVIWISVVAAVVVVGVVGAIIATNVYTSNENAKASAAPSVAASRAPSTLDTSDLAGTWTVGGGDTEAGYRVHEVLNGSDVTVTGRTDSVTGSATVDGTSITAATITVQVADIATDSDQRDSYFRDSAMDVSAFPTATFELSGPIADAVPSGDGTTTVKAAGKLTLHGVTKEVTASLEIGLNGDGVDVSGSIPITFSDYDVQAPNLGFVKVDDSGSVEFLVHATPGA